jgi:hypothetical protein
MRSPMKAVWLSIIVSAGCYHYLPVEPGDVPPGSTVRVRVTDAQTRRFENVVPVDGRLIQGKIIEQDPAVLLLEVPILTDLRGNRVETVSQRIDLPRSDVLDMEIRSLDRGKTALVFGVGGVAAVALVTRTLVGAFNSDNPTPPPGSEIVVPFFLRLRW